MGTSSNKELEKQNAKNRKFLSLILVFTFLLAGFLGWVYWNRFQTILSLHEEVERLLDEESRLRQEISLLHQRLNRRHDIDYIERLAKEELGLVHPSNEDT